MKSCVFGTLFLVIFLSYIHPGFGITTRDDDTYEILVQMSKGSLPFLSRSEQHSKTLHEGGSGTTIINIPYREVC